MDKEKQKPFKINMTYPTSEMLGKFILSTLETTEAWVVPIYDDSLIPQAEPEQVLSEFINVIRGFNTVLVGDKGILEAYEGFLEVHGVKRKDGTPEQIETQGWIESILDPSPDLEVCPDCKGSETNYNNFEPCPTCKAPDLVEQVAKWLFTMRYRMPNQRFHHSWHDEISASTLTEKEYCNLSNELLSLIRPSIEQEARKQGRKDVVDFFHENSVGVMMNEYALDAKLKEWGLSKEVGE